MKKMYEACKVEVLEFLEEDVLTTSLSPVEQEFDVDNRYDNFFGEGIW